MIIDTGLKRALLGAAALTAVTSIAPIGAHADETRQGEAVAVAIDAAPLADALRAFSRQSGVPVVFSDRLVDGKTAPSLSGTYRADDGLTRLLTGSGLEAAPGPEGVYVIRARQVTAPPPETPPARSEPAVIPAAAEDAPPEAEQDPGELRAQKVTVTGTSLRGIAPESSPLDIYGRADILRSGAATAEQFIRTLPQNFGGGSTEFAPIGFPGDSNSQRNDTYATGANLRGLGAGATLTLLDGNRLAPTSTIGDFVDLSLIPVSAIERVEVLSDGASSIYGGDAVAGVINFVLRDDFEGAETGLRYGTVTDGGLSEYRVSQAAGTSWDSGNLLAVYEFFDRNRLSLADRPSIAAAPLAGGGEVTDTGAFDLLPEQDRHSLLLSFDQAIGSRLDLSSTLLYSDRQVAGSSIGIGATATRSREQIKSESLSASLGLDYAISERWRVAFDGNYSKLRNGSLFQVVAPTVLNPSISNTSSMLWSAGLLADGDLFELPGGTVKASLGTQFRHEDFELTLTGSSIARAAERDVSAVYGEVFLPLIGEANALPFAKRVELNLSGRIDDYSDFGSTSNPKIGLLWAVSDDVRLRSSWSTSFTPPTLGQAGARDRVAAVIPYDLLRAVLGIALPDPSLAGVNYIVLNGTGTGLEPESSETLTIGADYDAEAGAHSFSAGITYYDIQFENRLGTVPVPGNLNFNFVPGLAFEDPDLFPAGTVIFFPSQAEIDAALSDLSQPISFLGGASAVENIGFINRVNLLRNLASTETSGFDVQVAYGADLEVGQVSAGLSANYIVEFENRAASTTPAIDTLNTLYNPVDLKLRARLGFARDGFSGTLFVNYTGSYRTDSTSLSEPVESWTTADLTLSYDFGPAGPRLMDGTQFLVSVTNVFDEPPPYAPPIAAFGLTSYDPANANPIGRFVSVELRKTF